MKLLVSELGALSGYVSREFYHVMRDLIDVHGWGHVETYRLWGGGRPLREALLEEFGELPEAILFWEGYDCLAERAGEVRALKCRKYIFADDLHCWDEEMRLRKLDSFALCGTVLASYGYAWAKYYPPPARGRRVVWVPHSASPDFMLPYNARPENSILLSGALTTHYPLRRRMKALRERRLYPIDYHPHPGYHCGHEYENGDGVGRGYAEKINGRRAGFTDSSVYGYVVAKYFEIPATGALLLAEGAVAEPLRRLGFVENVHYVSVSEENLEERIRYVLDERNRAELDEIRRRGQELVRERHKTSDRARQIDAVCRGVRGRRQSTYEP